MTDRTRSGAGSEQEDCCALRCAPVPEQASRLHPVIWKGVGAWDWVWAGWQVGGELCLSRGLAAAQVEAVIPAAFPDLPPFSSAPLFFYIAEDIRSCRRDNRARLVEQGGDIVSRLVRFALHVGPPQRTDDERTVDDVALVTGAAIGTTPRRLGGEVEHTKACSLPRIVGSALEVPAIFSHAHPTIVASRSLVAHCRPCGDRLR